jgi:hypothetical protein
MQATEIKKLIKDKNIKELRKLINSGILKVENGKIYFADKKYAKEQEEYWDKRQLVKKINLNSLYGAILNNGCRFFDKRIGQSTTLTGRQIVRHLAAKTNEIITGDYNHKGNAIIYGDTDSEIGSTIHQTNFGEKSIEELFAACCEFWNNGTKEYAYHPDLMVMSYNPDRNEPYFCHTNYIYRHKVTKDLYEIEDELGNTITVTEDHSVMVERAGVLIEIKPTDINDDDILISVMLEEVKHHLKALKPAKQISLHRGKVKSVKKIREAKDEYVYDIGIKDESKPWYFGNNILIHNSCYFSAFNTLQKDIANGSIPWTKETVIQLYDQIGEEVNNTFPQFMLDYFHCPKTRGEVIRAGRELVGSKSLFITKKRYAVLYYDKDGKRVDIDGKAGKIKVMGLDLRRSDTPDFIQNFLSEILEMVLMGKPEQEVLDHISEFRTRFKARPGWEKGSPKRANNITDYQAKEVKAGKANMPGHVRASINWNTLKRMYGDKYSMGITDGAKVIVCKLKPNPLQFTSVAYPVDELRLPQWFKDLPFDHAEMEQTIIDNKLDNLIGVLKWDIGSTEEKNTFNSLFEF